MHVCTCEQVWGYQGQWVPQRFQIIDEATFNTGRTTVSAHHFKYYVPCQAKPDAQAKLKEDAKCNQS